MRSSRSATACSSRAIVVSSSPGARRGWPGVDLSSPRRSSPTARRLCRLAPTSRALPQRSRRAHGQRRATAPRQRRRARPPGRAGRPAPRRCAPAAVRSDSTRCSSRLNSLGGDGVGGRTRGRRVLERPADRARLACGESEAELSGDVVDAGLPEAGKVELGGARGLEGLRRGLLEGRNSSARGVVAQGRLEHRLRAARLGRAALEQRVQPACLGQRLLARRDGIGKGRQLAARGGERGARPLELALLAHCLGDAARQGRLDRDGSRERPDDLAQPRGRRAQLLERGGAEALVDARPREPERTVGPLERRPRRCARVRTAPTTGLAWRARSTSKRSCVKCTARLPRVSSSRCRASRPLAALHAQPGVADHVGHLPVRLDRLAAASCRRGARGWRARRRPGPARPPATRVPTRLSSTRASRRSVSSPADTAKACTAMRISSTADWPSAPAPLGRPRRSRPGPGGRRPCRRPSRAACPCLRSGPAGRSRTRPAAGSRSARTGRG